MDDYKEKVKRLAHERTGESFYNNSPDHAAIIIESLLETAQSEACIVTTAMNPDVFGREAVVSAARHLLSDAKRSMRILIETDPVDAVSPGHPLVQELRQHNAVEVRQIPSLISNDMDYHFTVVDGDSFRFEPDKQKWEASAAFGDERNGKKLKSIFDSVWEMSQVVAL
ncbi:MAG: hypothetical protein H9535_16555, partial [Ignavibacteria bacterium]|nr:hypothetical protein [Ignavibacteria bacterium]